jgi:hypothetical protein
VCFCMFARACSASHKAVIARDTSPRASPYGDAVVVTKRVSSAARANMAVVKSLILLVEKCGIDGVVVILVERDIEVV